MPLTELSVGPLDDIIQERDYKLELSHLLFKYSRSRAKAVYNKRDSDPQMTERKLNRIFPLADEEATAPLH